MAFNFGLLRNWQKENRYTQVKAAECLGISQSFYLALIAGTKAPGFKTLEKICTKTGLKPADFIISDACAEEMRTKLESEKPIRKPRER